ncbi:hypothetical protein EBU71_20940 [bacterium]|nr:hypothetical protein [Candidatus Elulimicrobium humile]
MHLKSFENCRIAVCMSGEPRTYKDCSESINRYYTSKKGNQFQFFGHSWSGNSFKRFLPSGTYIFEYTKEDKDVIANDLKKHFNLTISEVEHQFIQDGLTSWFYSMMKSNFLKQKYEIENNMIFDLVVHSRYDLVFPPNLIFEQCMPEIIGEKMLYSHFGFYRSEFFLPNPDAVHYAGTSLTMDIIESFYNVWQNEAFDRMLGVEDDDNQFWRKVGPGVLIHRWATMRNIMPIDCFINQYAVYRKECSEKGLTYQKDYELIKKMEQAWIESRLIIAK